MCGKQVDLLRQNAAPNDTSQKPNAGLGDDGSAQDEIVVHGFVSLLGGVANASEKRFLLAEALVLSLLLFFGWHFCWMENLLRCDTKRDEEDDLVDAEEEAAEQSFKKWRKISQQFQMLDQARSIADQSD